MFYTPKHQKSNRADFLGAHGGSSSTRAYYIFARSVHLADREKARSDKAHTIVREHSPLGEGSYNS